VREVYMKFVDKKELFRIDGNRSIDAVAVDLLKVVEDFLKDRR